MALHAASCEAPWHCMPLRVMLHGIACRVTRHARGYHKSHAHPCKVRRSPMSWMSNIFLMATLFPSSLSYTELGHTRCHALSQHVGCIHGIIRVPPRQHTALSWCLSVAACGDPPSFRSRDMVPITTSCEHSPSISRGACG